MTGWLEFCQAFFCKNAQEAGFREVKDCPFVERNGCFERLMPNYGGCVPPLIFCGSRDLDRNVVHLMTRKAGLRSTGGFSRKLQLEPLEARDLLAAAADSPLEVEWGGTVVHDSDGDLFAVDMKGGSPVELLGTMGDIMSDMAFSPSGELFGLGGWPYGPSQLSTVEIDFDNPGGNLTTTWIATVYEPGLSNLDLNSLEFGPNGSLYGVGYGWETDGVFEWATDDYVYVVDTSMGAAQPLLWLGGHHAAGDLTFGEDGMAYTVTDNGILLAIESDFSGYSEVNTGSSMFRDYYGLTYGAGPAMFGFREAHEAYRINPDDAAQTYLGTMQHTSLGSINGAASVYRPPTTLEDMDFLELDNQTPILGELWYRIEAARDGILTADLPGLGSTRGVDMSLYSRDSAGDLDVLETGDDRVDYFDAVADGQYYLQITGVEAGLDVRLTNLVSPTATGVQVFDTQGNDTFEYFAGSTYVVTINGVSYQLATPGVETVEVTFTGTAGSDTAWLTGTNRDDVATLDATTGSGSLLSPGIRVDVASVAEIHVDGGGGVDSATITGTDGDDQATMELKSATLTTAQSVLDVSDVDVIQIDAGDGEDQSTFTGSQWAEKVFLYPDSALYHNYYAEPPPPSTHVPDYRIITSGIETKTATSDGVNSGGGDDIVELLDSDGDDTLTATPDQYVLSGTPTAGPDFTITANNFRYAHGYARNGGHDVASLTGSQGKDRLKVYPDYVKLMGNGYYNRAKFFESYTVDAPANANDTAIVYGSDAADVFWAMKNELRMDYDTTAAPGERPLQNLTYDTVAYGFEWVRAYAYGDSNDWAELHDSALNDVFIGKPHKSEIMNGPRKDDGVSRGDEYKITARKFRNVTAIADRGGEPDLAKLYDSADAGTDIWVADYRDGETWSTMTMPSRMLYEVLAFERVGGYGFNGEQGPDHGRNVKDHSTAVDFNFQYGYWED